MTAGIDVSVVTSGHDVADARLHREVAALRRAGLTVEVLALGLTSDAPAGCAVHTEARAGAWRRAYLAATLPWRARGRVVLVLDPDAAIGAYARRVLGGGRAALVADVHEDYGSLLADRAWAAGLTGRLARGLARAGQWAAAHADLTVVADAHLLPRAPRRLVVRNLPDPAMLPPGGAGTPDRRPRALYVGDLRDSRGLFTMVDAVRAAPDWQLDLVGPLARRDQAKLSQALSAEPGLADRLALLGRQAPAPAWSHAVGAWAGLLLLQDTPAFRASMPSKIYEYLACGLPVITTPLPRPAALVGETGAGRVVADAAEAAAVLREWSADPAAYGAAAAAARAARGRAVAEADEMALFGARLARLAGRG
ncbi:MAG: glycosyltransferase [Bifidobacteriaceae bacterium]|nr:glycosyltransferase [Bifidobacteriaceae bacterium]